MKGLPQFDTITVNIISILVIVEFGSYPNVTIKVLSPPAQVCFPLSSWNRHYADDILHVVYRKYVYRFDIYQSYCHFDIAVIPKGVGSQSEKFEMKYFRIFGDFVYLYCLSEMLPNWQFYL